MIEPREITESFRLERVLKSSRSAIVFRAVDPATGKVVAIKLIPPGTPEDLEACQARFLGAMAAAAGLPAGGIAPILDHGFTPDGSAFMVMDFVAGVRVDSLTGCPPDRTLRLMLDTVRGLEALAARGVGHGNLSPDNLLLVRRDDGEGVAILGFGTAAFQAESAGGGEAPGRFVAPERRDPAVAARQPDWRSDLYSLALTTCELLGAKVAQGDAETPTVALPPTARERLADPVVLRAILEQALRRNPDTRPTSLAEFREGIQLALEGVPGHEALVPEVEAAAAIVAAETLPAPPLTPVEEPFETPPLGELAGAVPIAHLEEFPDHEPAPEAGAERPQALPEAVEVPTPAPTATPAPAERPLPARAPRSRLALWLALAAGALVVIAGATVVLMKGRGVPPPTREAAAPTRAPRRPTPAPQPTAQPGALTQLQNAEAAIALGDLASARLALDAITQADLEALSTQERDRYASLRATYDSRMIQTLTRQLAGALAGGNLKALAETVRGISREDEAGFARNDDLLAALEEARRVLNLQSLMLKAQKQGDWPEVLKQSSVLVSLVPRYTPAAESRERAAAALERDADSAAAGGNYEVALARLETVRRSWPDREGVGAHIERVKADRATDEQLAAVLAAAERAERDKVPEKGLAALAATSPPPRWQERVRETRDRLAAQLKQLDAAPPNIALTPGGKLEYKKNEPGTITLKITDDHGLKSAKLFARLEGSGQYVELPLRPGPAGDYTAEISPAFHKNSTVEFYAVAADFSDHAAELGSAQDPLKLKRKKWSLFGR